MPGIPIPFVWYWPPEEPPEPPDLDLPLEAEADRRPARAQLEEVPDFRLPV